jgi:predicted amidohydrolase
VCRVRRLKLGSENHARGPPSVMPLTNSSAGIWATALATALIPALVATAKASVACSFPPTQRAGAVAGTFDAPFTCLPGNVAPGWGDVSVTAPGPVAPPLHLDTKATVYDLSPVASFVDSATGRVKAAIIPRSSNVTSLANSLKSAKQDGADIALITEEDFQGGADQPGEPLTGPHITAIAATAKSLNMYVVCPFRISISPDESYNGAVIISRNGTILSAAKSGATHYEKVFPVLGWPIPSLSDKFPGGQKAGFSIQGGEVPVIPGQKGVQVWDLEGIGRVAILICFDINYYELWHQAYALGAQVVFWPSMMSTPDRDAISLSRLFRFHIVSNGRPGNIHDTTVRSAVLFPLWTRFVLLPSLYRVLSPAR